MNAFKAFDYFAIAIGILATLNVFGVLQPMVFILGPVSALICCFSILSLALNRFVPHLASQQQRLHLYHILANLIPTIYILTHLKETTYSVFHY